MTFMIPNQEMDNAISNNLSRMCMRFGNCDCNCIHIVHLLSFFIVLLILSHYERKCKHFFELEKRLHKYTKM